MIRHTSGTFAMSIGRPANLGVVHWWNVHQQSLSLGEYVGVKFEKSPVMVP